MISVMWSRKTEPLCERLVGYDRFVGVQAYQQLGELYRALRLYINCFQLCMKLQGKYYDGRKVRLVYDPAKTPLQRLLLSEVLPASRGHEWKEMVQALDPVRLFEQVKDLQQALFIHSTSALSHSKEVAVVLYNNSLLKSVRQDLLRLTFLPQRWFASRTRTLVNCLQRVHCWSGIGHATIRSRRSGNSLPPGSWPIRSAPVERSCGNYNVCFLIATSRRICAPCSEGCARSERDCEPQWSCSGSRT